MDYIAKRDIPALGIRQGKVFFDEDDPIFQDPTLFDEYIPEVYILTTDTPVSITGYFKELGDRRCVLNGRLKNTVVKINEPMLGTVKKLRLSPPGYVPTMMYESWVITACTIWPRHPHWISANWKTR